MPSFFTSSVFIVLCRTEFSCLVQLFFWIWKRAIIFVSMIIPELSWPIFLLWCIFASSFPGLHVHWGSHMMGKLGSCPPNNLENRAKLRNVKAKMQKRVGFAHPKFLVICGLPSNFQNHGNSWNPSKRAGPNKRAGLQISENLINVQGGMHPSCQKIDKNYIKNEWIE